MAFKTSVAWYVGCPGAGKTTLAREHLAELVAANGWPAFVVDSQGVAQLDDVPHAATLDEALRVAFGAGEHVAYIPRGPLDFECIVRAALSAGRVNLLVDEAAFWITSHAGRTSPLMRLMRAHRHAPACLLLTTQHFSGDVSQQALSCAPRLYVFRCTSRAVLERLESDYGLDPAEVRALPRGKFFTLDSGFPS